MRVRAYTLRGGRGKSPTLLWGAPLFQRPRGARTAPTAGATFETLKFWGARATRKSSKASCGNWPVKPTLRHK